MACPRPVAAAFYVSSVTHVRRTPKGNRFTRARAPAAAEGRKHAQGARGSLSVAASNPRHGDYCRLAGVEPPCWVVAGH